MKNPPRFLASFLFVGILLSANGATFTVDTLADSEDRGSLRWAVQKANDSPGSTIDFAVAGTVGLSSPLPAITSSVNIDGTSAPGFGGSPRVAVDFGNSRGLVFEKGADSSSVLGLSLVRASDAAIKLRASQVTVAGNYIGLLPDGSVSANSGDGIKIESSANGNVIGSEDPVEGIRYFNTANPKKFKMPVTVWEGIRNYQGSSNNFLISGQTGTDGLLYLGALAGGGRSYKVKYPNAASTSVYGPDSLENGNVRLVGSYAPKSNKGPKNFGFIWEGSLNQLPGGGKFRTIDYPGAKVQFTHSTMGGLAVGNALTSSNPDAPSVAYIYDVEKADFVNKVEFPGSKTTTVYGIWHNGERNYTICGGYSDVATNNMSANSLPLFRGRAFLVDYDAKTRKFSHWTSFRYRNGKAARTFETHFEGISSEEPGVYTMNADSVDRGGEAGPVQGSWISIRRKTDGRFSDGEWVDLNYPGVELGLTSSNSVYGNHVVGIAITESSIPFQATIRIGFQLSNVISGNDGNGIAIRRSNRNVIAQNYIGTDPSGRKAVPNKKSGIYITSRSRNNLIGGQSTARNNPTGTKGSTKPVFEVPPQGNLISGNKRNGIHINRSSDRNTISGNFIGTNVKGNTAIGNGQNGVNIDASKGNSFIGCTLNQNPFVFYNVISGNRHQGIRLNDADNTTVQANFIGVGANNSTLVPNGRNGLAVTGSSKNTQVGGVIPLGNVISGNGENGIFVGDTASGFISFNTFGGTYAFGPAAPNGANGILITATGGNNVVRTCILSGNLGNGVEISGDATGVEVTDTACGTNTDISAALPNGASGVLISGTAHGNAIGGFQPSIEVRNHFAGNLSYGIAVTGQAYDNAIFGNNVGLGDVGTDGLNPAIPNQMGGIYLGAGTSGTVIGDSGAAFVNRIKSNVGGGLSIIASTANVVRNNEIQSNTAFGLYATGACDGTVASGNTITANGTGPVDNVDIATATGIVVVP